MHRFYIDPRQREEDSVVIQGEQLRKVRTVLRMNPGDAVVVFDNTGTEYLCRIESLSPGRGVLSVKSRRQTLPEPRRRVHLGQGLPKADKMASIIQKAVELGVGAIHPFTATRSVPKCGSGDPSKKVVRWRKIAVEAAQQSGRGTVPDVNAPVPFDDVIRLSLPNPLKIILLPDNEGRPLPELLSTGKTKQSVLFLVGPEGGFSSQETELARKQGFEPVRLGDRTLRTDTAALVFLSILQYEFGEIS